MDSHQAEENLDLESSSWKVWCSIYGILSFFIIVVNTLALFTFIKTPSLKCRKHIMVINLAVADLSYGALGLPTFIYYVFKPTLISFNVSTVLTSFSKLVCLFSVTAIAMDRMYSVVWPIHHKVISINVYKCAVMAVWIVSAGVATFEMYNWGTFSKKPKTFIPVLLIALLVAGIVTIGCYVCIWFKARRRRKRTTTKQDRNLVFTLLLVTGVFMVTWGIPISFLSVSRMCKKCYQFSAVAFKCMQLLFALQSLINPIIYCFRLPTFKISLKMRLQELKSSGRGIAPRRSSKVTAKPELWRTSVIKETPKQPVRTEGEAAQLTRTEPKRDRNL